MRTILTTAAVLGLTLAPAMAQSQTQTSQTPAASNPTTAPMASNSTTPAPIAPGAMQDALKADLSQAGFTDIQVMPSSFLVRAKDKAGHPIMMVINPDSITEISNVGKPATTK